MAKKKTTTSTSAAKKKPEKVEGTPLAACVPDYAEDLAKAGFQVVEQVLPLNVDALMKQSGLDKHAASVVKHEAWLAKNPQNAPPSGGGGAH